MKQLVMLIGGAIVLGAIIGATPSSKFTSADLVSSTQRSSAEVQKKPQPKGYAIWANGSLGCRYKESAERILRMMVERDAQAAALLAHAHGCELLPAGTQLLSVDLSILARLAKVRRRGDPTEWWIPIDHLANTY